MPDRENQVVAGEPSMGTWYPHYNQFLNIDPVDTNWHEVSLAAQVPTGTKAICGILRIRGTGVGEEVQLSNASGGTVYAKQDVQVSDVDNYFGFPFLPLSATLTVWYKATNANVSVFTVEMTAYSIA